MKKRKTLRRLLIAAIALVAAGALAAGGLLLARGNAQPVEVMPFQYVGMTEFWGDSQETSGLVTTDGIQTVFLSDTQTVTQILVQQGDTVKKGDLLMTFDTTLDGLALEKERLKVEKLRLELQDAQAQLARINQMRPMVIPPEPPQVDEDLGLPLAGAWQLISPDSWDGSQGEKALICWLGSTTAIDDALLESLLLQARQLQKQNQQPDPTDPADPTDPTEETAATDPTDPTDPAEPEIYSYFVIFKLTGQDMSLGQTLTWQGLEVLQDPDTGAFRFRFWDAEAVADPTLEQPETPEFDFGSGFTAQQIHEMRLEQQKTIKDLELRIKMAEAEYKIKLSEAEDGNVYARLDGTVVSLLEPQQALDTMQPVLKISGGGGFQITGSASELVLDTLTPGQEVTVMDWNTGGSYTGTISAIRDYPGQGMSYGMGNPNVSYYDFTVFVEESADLMEGSYASITFSAAGVSSGIYLENPYIRTEGGRSWVFVRGEEGLLEKRFVTTGRSLWGSYTQILSGLTEADLIAFPYGKHVVEGAPTEEWDPYY